MKYMLDTNICVYLMKRSVPGLLERVIRHRRGEVVVSAISAAELELGVAKSARVVENQNRLMLLLTEVTAMPFDAEAAKEYGRVRAALEKRGTPIGPLDTLIAAHALALGLTLVTNNQKEFKRVAKLRLENWAAD